MGFIERMNAGMKKYSFNKTGIVNHIKKHEQFLLLNDQPLRLKNEYDYFGLEVVLNGLINRKIIDDSFQMFTYDNKDMTQVMNYNEIKTYYNGLISEVLKELPHFTDDESGEEIYIPCYEAFINKYFTKDYQLMQLKQHREYIKNFKITPHTPIELYGYKVFKSDFSSLIPVFEDDRHIDFFVEDMQKVYSFLKEDFTYINSFILSDHKKRHCTPEDAELLMPLFEDYKYEWAINMMLQQNLISEWHAKKLKRLL